MSKRQHYLTQKHEGLEDWPEDGVQEELPEEKSKSQVKREMLALQQLGEELVALPPAQLERVEMSEKLRDAVELCQRITAHGGRDRQMQYIGRIMRDEDVEPLQRALAELRFSAQKQAQQFHQLERWRERLIAEGDTALGPYMDEHPQADRQKLRQLIRQAQKESKEGKSPSAARELFKLLKTAQQE